MNQLITVIVIAFGAGFMAATVLFVELDVAFIEEVYDGQVERWIASRARTREWRREERRKRRGDH